VLIPVYRNPVMLAKQIGTLTALAGDRVVLGVGAGWMEEEFAAVGVEPSERGARLDEYLTLVRRAWTDGISEFDGRFVSHVRGGFYPVPGRPVPIIVGGWTDAALRRVARLGDGWAMPTFRPGPELDAELRGGLDRLRRACDAEGRDADELTIVVGTGIDTEPAAFDSFAGTGVDDVDLMLSDPADLDLDRPARVLGELTRRFGDG
jgi:alkanesulfonate monooxygenase SsuD/methylene tetrahydromethanopterin reductase-like flavin-dependent oxidoreductase (luciferase family)